MKERGISEGTALVSADRLYEEGRTVLYFADETMVIGLIAVADTPKSTSAGAISEFKKMGIETVMFSFSEIAGSRISQKKGWITAIHIVDLAICAFGILSKIAGYDLSQIWAFSDLANICIVFCNIPILYVGFRYVMQDSSALIPLKEIAKRQEITLKYMEQIITPLSKAGYVTSLRGSSGGYRLAKNPSEYTVGDILRVMPHRQGDRRIRRKTGGRTGAAGKKKGKEKEKSQQKGGLFHKRLLLIKKSVFPTLFEVQGRDSPCEHPYAESVR